MESITIDGMDEHDFRHDIEDMLRSDQGHKAIEKLRGLLEPYVGYGEILPPRFLDVTPENVEFTGWRKLAGRLLRHDRPGFVITAIGVVLSDSRVLGGRGPENGRLAPFVKTFYFSDDAYPFSDATRDDLLDGYTREGFGWQGDYQATDATLSINGIDDLYGAIVELEDRLMKSDAPSEDEIRAGTIGACYLAALIHQSLRDTILKNGLPRPLCVLAACDGVYPFFDAPVAGQDETTVTRPAADELVDEAEAEAGELDGEEAATAGPAEDLVMPSPEASLLEVAPRRHSKTMALTLDEKSTEDAARYAEMAAASRMEAGSNRELIGVLSGTSYDSEAVFEPDQPPVDEDDDMAMWDEEELEAEVEAAERNAEPIDGDESDEVDENRPELPESISGLLHGAPPPPRTTDEPEFQTASSNSFRAKLNAPAQEAANRGPNWLAKIKWFIGLFTKP